MNVFKKRNTKFLFAEIDHTGVYKWQPKYDIEICPLFGFCYTYENEGQRIRRFRTNFSSN